MLTLEEIKKKKEECGYSNEKLSEISGVPLETLLQMMGAGTKKAPYESLKALASVFEREEKEQVDFSHVRPSCLGEQPIRYGSGMRRPLAENIHRYERQGNYTLEDYLALPEDRRVELIDGVFYDMGAPSAAHQLIGGLVHAQILDHIKKKNGTCVPFIAPTDVQLDCDNRTIVQPDVFVVCDRTKLNLQRMFGAPDFVLEVLSPSTRNKDILIKFGKYQNAGVREYWLVDPMKRRILVWQFGEDLDFLTYSFGDKVPVGIFDGELEIDFREISDYIAFLYEKPADSLESNTDPG